MDNTEALPRTTATFEHSTHHAGWHAAHDLLQLLGRHLRHHLRHLRELLGRHPKLLGNARPLFRRHALEDLRQLRGRGLPSAARHPRHPAGTSTSPTGRHGLVEHGQELGGVGANRVEQACCGHGIP